MAGARHENILRKSIEHHCGVPVLGAVPKLGGENFPERHMGLVPTPEHHWANEAIAAAGEVASRMAIGLLVSSVVSTAERPRP